MSLGYVGKYLTKDKSKTVITKTKHNPEKANNAKHSKTKLPWFIRLIQHSARKRGGLILQCSRAHAGLDNLYNLSSTRVLFEIVLAVDILYHLKGLTHLKS